MVETLEGRRLLSANAFVSHSILHVDGSLVDSNTITVDDNGTAITVSIDYTTARGVPKTFSSSFLKSLGFTEVFIKGGLKADTINVGQQSSTPFSIPTKINGLGGSDTITTAAESDTITGGTGSDVISSGDGNDIVRGGFGANMITVGNGNDKVKAGYGFGESTVVAGDGTDTVAGSPGADKITVGNGNDLVHGAAGNDTIVAGNGNDTLWGGLGDDDITAGNGTDTFGGLLGSNTLMGGTGSDTFVVRFNFPEGQTTSYNAAKDHLDRRHFEPPAPVV
jgi:Ca2+-binding RTX toxin-like protein